MIYRVYLKVYVKILIEYIYKRGAKGSKDSGPFHIKPKAHAEEEEMPEEKQRESKLPRYTADDDLTKITEGESATLPEAVLSSILKEVPSPVGQP